MKDFQREDYIYLRVIEDYKEKSGVEIKKGEILRYRKEWLIEKIAGRQLGQVFNYGYELEYIKNENPDENDVLYHKVYQSITVSKDRKYRLCIWPGDYLYLNDWLFEHLDESGIQTILRAEKNVLPDGKNTNSLVEITNGNPRRNIEVYIYFRKGEILDFTNPAVMALFYDMEWMKTFAKTEVITGKEKEELFKEDFSNAIYAQVPYMVDIWDNDPTRNINEYHYFKIMDEIKVQTKQELTELIKEDIHYSIDFIKDEEGYLRYAVTNASDISTSYRDIEQEILEYATRMTKEEATECHNKQIEYWIKEKRMESAQWEKEEAERQKKLKELYSANKNNPAYFPGVNGAFIHNDNKNTKKEKYTLAQMKEFYQNLKKLEPSIVQEMCFYGGTVPYILNDAIESRDFGDIDIFFPVPLMERLRTELAKQESFQMIYDSKPLAMSCQLTSRINKSQTELVDEKQEAQELLSLLVDSMLEEDVIDVDETGNTYNPFEAFFKKNRPYYNKPQDFGFKAKLFGVNISVFPIYPYNNHIMAKSFNVSEKYKFLLGVKVLNNTEIKDFVREIKVYDSVLKILPLEYTLISKKSAVDENYSYRLDKDRADVEYILSHQEELGIEEEKLQEIAKNYPDYSVSIAYRVNDNGTTTTMPGELYKELVLTNRQIS